MFKGLRTKIESEQRVQDVEGRDSKENTRYRGNKIDIDRETNPGNGRILSPTVQPVADGSEHGKGRLTTPRDPDSLSPSAAVIPTSCDKTFHKPIPNTPDESSLPTIDRSDHLKEQVQELNQQLETLMRDKGGSHDQNALIENLRRNLETERETNSSLREKLNQFEIELKNLTEQPKVSARTINLRPIDHDVIMTAAVEDKLKDVANLQLKIIELQAQIAKKNRLLKIRQQNLNDLKKTLQREMMDHGKTQEELAKTQKQLKELEAQLQLNLKEPHLLRQNGSVPQDSSDNVNLKRDLNQNTNDKNPQDQEQTPATMSSVGGADLGTEDAVSLTALGAGAHLDRISYLSRSSASVDEIELNEFQQTNYNREVNHEYLKNVLYRYMTSTDNETTKHLVKALTVLMEFSPDQSAAIKSAMHARSSWLRLK